MAIRTWLREQDRQVKAGRNVGAPLVVRWLSKKAPWQNPTKPKWLHGKRAVAEPAETLDEVELMVRGHDHFDPAVHLLQSTAVS